MDTSESPRATSPVAPLVRSPSAPLVRSPSFPNNGSVPTPVLSGVGPLYEPIQKMRGIHVSMFGGSDVLKLRTDLIVPPLTPTQVLVRVMYTGINPVETYIREGQYSRLPDLPYIPGSDAAGYVEKVGSHVNGIVPGTKVFVTGFNSGSYAQYVVSDYHYVFPLHGRLTFAQGAAIGVPYFTAYKALIMGACTKPGENVLIHGASGAVGTAAVQIARSLGAIVVGTAGTKDGMDVVGKCGAHHVFNHNHKNYEKKMIEAVGGVGFDVIIEHLANINLGHDLMMLKAGGRVMVVGCRGSVSINPRHLMLSEASIRGVQLQNTTVTEYKEIGSAIVTGIESGSFNPVINREYPLEDVQQVHYDIIHLKGAKGKLVLKVGQDED